MDKDKEVVKEVVNEETLNIEQEEEAGLKDISPIAGDGVAACC
ncbi:hypothetical protein [Clostridium sp. KNHs205]|jgi:hypothetical protein|nr:hypothetical protein [Clostridium sp. KNHs205]